MTQNVSKNYTRDILHTVIYFGQVDFVPMLMRNGANVKNTSSDQGTALGHCSGNTVLHYVTSRRSDLSKEDRARLARMFVRAGADVNALNLDRMSGNKESALYKAIKNNFVDVAKELIQSGADVNSSVKLTGRLTDTGTSLHLIAAEKNLDLALAKLVIMRVKNINATSQSLKNTALHLCAYRAHTEFAKLLIRNGADLNALDVNNQGVRSVGGRRPYCLFLIFKFSKRKKTKTKKQTKKKRK